MSYPDWPAKSVNYRAVSGGTECTISTTYNKVKLSASATDLTADAAERRALRDLNQKIRQRKSFK